MMRIVLFCSRIKAHLLVKPKTLHIFGANLSMLSSIFFQNFLLGERSRLQKDENEEQTGIQKYRDNCVVDSQIIRIHL